MPDQLVLPENRPLRAGVVGVGAFGRHHAAKYAAFPGVELAGVADPCSEARKLAHSRFGCPAYANWRELVGRVDVVSVASPATTHAAIVRAFLESGAHVLVEKPIATNVDAADELIALADVTGRILTVGHQERFVFARTGLLHHGVTPASVECWRLGPWSGRGDDVSVVLDLMIHDLDIVHRLVPGQVARVAARGLTEKSRLRDDVSARIEFENGTDAMLHASRVAGARRRGMRIVYPDGVIEIDFIARSVRNTTGRMLRALELDDPLGESVGAFLAAVRSGGAALVRPEEARRALETALLIDEAAAPAGEPRSQDELAIHA